MKTIRATRLCVLWLLAGSLSISIASAETYTVTATRDSLAGSLRQAIEEANAHAGPDTILFNIPASDPGYAAGVFTIRPDTALPDLTDDGTVVDGTSQSAHQGDTNPLGPEIELDGTEAGTSNGLTVLGGSIQIRGLVINRFAEVGIRVMGTTARGALIVGNYIGTDPTGMIGQGNEYGGIWVEFGANGARIGGSTMDERNIISGAAISVNLKTGTGVYVEEADSIRIIGNYVGVNRDATATLPNKGVGVCIRETHHTVIGGTNPGEGNVIGGNHDCGIVVRMPTATMNTISGNFIGTDPSGLLDLGNSLQGIQLDFGARNNMIGPSNTIMFSTDNGVRVRHDSTFGNTISGNTITRNTNRGISHSLGGNGGLPPPIIAAATATAVSGSAAPGRTVEIFSDSADEGAVFEGAVLADAGGNFSWMGAPRGPNVTATCTDTAGNTSEFAAPVVVTGVSQDAGPDLPGTFILEQNYPNPFNPSTTIRYGLPVQSHVTLTVYNTLGQQVAALVRGEQEPGYHEAVFDAAGHASGVYLCRLQVRALGSAIGRDPRSGAGDFTETRKLLLVR